MMKELYDYIFRRKSTRAFTEEPMTDQELEEMDGFLKRARHLFPEEHFRYRIVREVRKLLPLKAPYYLLIYGDGSDESMMNIGFIFQQLDLHLSSIGIGACWLGTAKPGEEKDQSPDYRIAIAFGKTAYPPYRDPQGFKRKPLDEISNGWDERIEAARLAPSAVNGQPWFFESVQGELRVYRKKLSPLEKLVSGRWVPVDMGIALAHIYIASEYQGREFVFIRDPEKPNLKGLTYVGTVQ